MALGSTRITNERARCTTAPTNTPFPLVRRTPWSVDRQTNLAHGNASLASLLSLPQLRSWIFLDNGFCGSPKSKVTFPAPEPVRNSVLANTSPSTTVLEFCLCPASMAAIGENELPALQQPEQNWREKVYELSQSMVVVCFRPSRRRISKACRSRLIKIPILWRLTEFLRSQPAWDAALLATMGDVACSPLRVRREYRVQLFWCFGPLSRVTSEFRKLHEPTQNGPETVKRIEEMKDKGIKGIYLHDN